MPAHYAAFLMRGVGAALLAAGLATTVALTQAHASDANDLVVRYDQSTLLRLPRPIADVIIGNPTIADVNVQSGNLLVITGKSFGVTNIITLDSQRNVIQDQRVIVRQDDARTVNLHRGATKASFNCAPVCQSVLSIGDDPAHFDIVHKSTTSKLKISDSVAENSGQPSQ